MNIKDCNKNTMSAHYVKGIIFVALKLFSILYRRDWLVSVPRDPLDSAPDGSTGALGPTCGTVSTFAHTREKSGPLGILQTCNLGLM